MAGGRPISRGSEEEDAAARRRREEEEHGEGTTEDPGEASGDERVSKKKEKGREDEEGKEGIKTGDEEDEEETEVVTATTSSEDSTANIPSSPTSTAALVVKQMPSSSRAMRNMAEKMRRDKLNTYISQLATLVPMVSSSPRRLDKTSVLRLSATFLRMHRTLIPPDGQLRPFLPKALKSFNLSEKVLEDMNGFLLVVMASGKIVFVSQHVERLLGHTQNDLLGQSIFGITHADDHKLLAINLSPELDGANETKEGSDAVKGKDILVSDSKCHPGPSKEGDQAAKSHPSGHSNSRCNKRLSFHVRLSQRAVGRGESAGYEMVHIVGQLRSASAEESHLASSGKANDSGPAQSSSSASPLGESVMVAVARVCRERQILELSLMEACKDEYLTRHGLHGEILNCDHRISVVAGYLADEVKGQSAFSFMHDSDARWTFIALQRMFSSPDGFGKSCYRLKSKTGQYIYLRTQGHCEFDRITGKFDTFVCINTLVSEEEGKKAVEEMKQRYSACISERALKPNAIMGKGSPRGLDETFSKSIKTAAEESKEIALPSASHQIISSVAVQSLPSNSTQTSRTMIMRSTEVVMYETNMEEVTALTPKSYTSSSSPPPLVPFSFPSSSSPPYVYDPNLPIEAFHPLPYSPSKTSNRMAEKQLCSTQEGPCIPPVPNVNSLKRPPPSTSSTHTRPAKRLHHATSTAPQRVEELHPSSPTSWSPVSCVSVREPGHLAPTLPVSPHPTSECNLHPPVEERVVGREVSSYNSQLLEVEGNDIKQPNSFPEEENRISGWSCNEVRPSNVDLSTIDRNSDFPDLREDVEQLEILSMGVEPELADNNRWEISDIRQMPEAEGTMVLSESIVTGTDEQAVEGPVHGGIRRSHRRLRLRLDSQGRTMASLERELSGLAGSHIIEGDLARLRVERKKQMHILQTLEQEHMTTIATQEKTKAFGIQNVGV